MIDFLIWQRSLLAHEMRIVPLRKKRKAIPFNFKARQMIRTGVVYGRTFGATQPSWQGAHFLKPNEVKVVEFCQGLIKVLPIKSPVTSHFPSTACPLHEAGTHLSQSSANQRVY